MSRSVNLIGATVLGLAGSLAACEPPGQDVGMLDGDPSTQLIGTENGLAAVNGLTASNGLVASNGLMTSNGLATSNGLMTSNGLATSNGLMTSNGGRLTVKYLVRCALPAWDSVTKQDQTGTVHTFQGGLGLAPQWKTGSCDATCQEWISACMLAHLNSTGNQVPIWVTADPNKMPHVGWGEAWMYGRGENVFEGTYFGNIFTTYPPNAYYVQQQGFKGNIPGRLGASSSNPYKPWQGYRPDSGSLFVGNGGALCLGRVNPSDPDGKMMPDNCGTASAPFQGYQGKWHNIINTFVNSNYSGAVTQNNVVVTLNFENEALGLKTNTEYDVWTTTSNFEFRGGQEGKISIDAEGATPSKRLCIREGRLTITKNTGEPFSLNQLDLRGRWNTESTHKVTVTGYYRTGGRTRMELSVPVGGHFGAVSTQQIWGFDGVNKVELNAPTTGVCFDNIKLKT